jgi:proline dehydrogenase
VVIFNKIISNLVPYFPRSLTYQFAKRYVAGTTKETALETIKKLNDSGYLVTLDILGEHTRNKDIAADITAQYIDLYREIDARSLQCNISLKPTHIGSEISVDTYNQNLQEIINISENTNNFVRIDMESSSHTDFTINSFLEQRKNNLKIGTVFQAYLFRTYDDVTALDPENLNFRLCKGIYKESDDVCINDRVKINENYLKILRYAFEKNIYVGIATHDTDLLESVYALIDELHVPSDRFEFQVLYGVPMHGWSQKNLENGYRVRVYVPFGEDWYKYSIRRLKENPDIAGYIVRNLFSK